MKSTFRLSGVVLASVGAFFVACSSGSTGPAGPAGATGAQGPAGTSGTSSDGGSTVNPGTLSAYGDGAGGAKTIASADGGGTLVELVDHDLEYTDFTVPAGITLMVESGAVIRCTGTFTNNGTIVVQPPFILDLGIFQTDDGNVQPADPGITGQAAGAGTYGTTGVNMLGGSGGGGLDVLGASQIYLPGLRGGGSGYSSALGGDPGGGTMVVIANAISMGASAAIHANGGNYNANSATALGSGGAGGIVILAAKTKIDAAGTLTANGGNGSNASGQIGAMASGGGGIIHFIAPTLNVTATVQVTNGTAGHGGTTVAAGARFAGMGGGGCGGIGGSGGDISVAGVTGDATAGGFGFVIQDSFDPSALFL